MKKIQLHFVLLLSLLLTAGSTLAENTAKPFVVPELKEWKSGKGIFEIHENSKVVYPKGNEKLKTVANQFAEDYKTMFGKKLTVSDAKAQKGDFEFKLAKNSKLGEEGYQIKIADRTTVTAPEPIGVFWATRTLLQMAEQGQNQQLPQGDILDFPDYKMRGFMLDCGRKFIPLAFLQDYVKLMAYYKMNTFHIHLNDNGFLQYFENDWNKTYSAFRLESETYPGLEAQDGYYTKKEFIDLQILAENNFVDIIPEIDIPAHSLAFAQYNPVLGSEEYGMDHLDLFKPETYQFFDALFKEYLEGDEPVFRGKRVHVGTDEYSNKKKEVVEKFRYFTDYYIKYVESFGKQACIWGALTHAKGDTPVKANDVVMWAWHNNYAQPDDMIKEGYKLVSIPDGLLYIVPNAGYYYDYLNCEKLYKEWTPAHIGEKVFDEKHPMIEGGMFAVWNDHVGNGTSTKDIHHRVLPALQTLATKMWTGKSTTFDYASFDEKRKNISEAPGLNIEGRIGNKESLVYETTQLRTNSKTDYTEIGYNYTITFTIDGANEEKGTVLFSSPDAEFFLADPIKGLMGFARDGYLNTINYKVEAGKKTEIKICGDNYATRFYIDGVLKHNLSPKTMHFKRENGKDEKMTYVSTLVFPLEKSGNFKSKISNFKVYNYLMEDAHK